MMFSTCEEWFGVKKMSASVIFERNLGEKRKKEVTVVMERQLYMLRECEELY